MPGIKCKLMFIYYSSDLNSVTQYAEEELTNLISPSKCDKTLKQISTKLMPFNTEVAV